MTLKEIYSDGLIRKCQVTIDSNTIDSSLSTAVKEKIDNRAYPGFRRGKAPEWIVLKQEKDLLDRVIVDQVYKTWTDEKKKANLSVFEGSEKICDVNVNDYKDKKDDVKFSVEYEIDPDIPSIDCDLITVDKKEFDINDDDVNGYLQCIKQDSYFHRDAVNDYEIHQKDGVYCDIHGKINGKSFKGGSKENLYLRIGEDKILSDLENGMIGLKVGGEKLIPLVFPADYHDSNLAGKSAVFNVKINKVMESVLADTDDLLMEKFQCKDIEELIKICRGFIQSKCDAKVRDEQVLQLKEWLLKDKQYDFLIPESLKEKQKKLLRGYTQYSNLPEDEFQKHVNDNSKLSLLLSKFRDEHQINITEKDITEHLVKIGGHRRDYVNYLAEIYKENKDFADKIALKVIEDKIISEILSKINMNKVNVAINDILNDLEKDIGMIKDE